MWAWWTSLARRWRAAREAAAAWRALRRRFAEERARGRPSIAERRLAAALVASREGLAAAFGDLLACARCAAHEPRPIGRWPGGYCCAGRTEDLFDEEAVAALRAGGTRPRHLRRGAREPAGCRFRGPAGCTLSPRHRPDRCLRYRCGELERELVTSGALAAVDREIRENLRLSEEFRTLRGERLAAEFCRRLAAAATAGARRR
jgi:hypothetical protein